MNSRKTLSNSELQRITGGSLPVMIPSLSLKIANWIIKKFK